MVLKARMAASGLSFSCLYFLSRWEAALPSCSFIVMKDIGVERRTASRIEQRKEMIRAEKR